MEMGKTTAGIVYHPWKNSENKSRKIKQNCQEKRRSLNKDDSQPKKGRNLPWLKWNRLPNFTWSTLHHALPSIIRYKNSTLVQNAHTETDSNDKQNQKNGWMLDNDARLLEEMSRRMTRGWRQIGRGWWGGWDEVGYGMLLRQMRRVVSAAPAGSGRCRRRGHG